MSLISKFLQFPVQKSGELPFINHDNVLLASPEEQKRLIFYFIASQAPQKIDNRDHESFYQRRYTNALVV